MSSDSVELADTSPPSPPNNLTSHPSLLGVTAEMRNEIYNHLVLSTTSILTQYDLVPHPLARTCRQLRQEFQPVFKASSLPALTTIKVRTQNFDFDSTLTMLRKLGGIQIGRTISISFNIALTSIAETEANYDSLASWCDQVDCGADGKPDERLHCEYYVAFDWQKLARQERICVMMKMLGMLRRVAYGLSRLGAVVEKKVRTTVWDDQKA